jgi:UDP-N-acetylglucosamine 2-epimerase (non-hydrolysing)
MIHIVVGTKAQLIKMAPVMRRLKDQDIEYNYIATGQHRDTMDEIHDNFGIKGPDVVLYDGPDITAIREMFFWSLRILWHVLTQRKEIFHEDKHGIVLVHGDTFSAALGALMGRVGRLKVAHVESGLRSFDIFQPFPEELTRILTFWLSHIYFCPGDWALENLKAFRGEKVNTQFNTMLDSLRHALANNKEAAPRRQKDGPFGIVTIHRFENIFDRKALERAVDIICRISESMHLVFILHKPTKQNLEKFGLMERLKNAPNIELHPRYDYFQFMHLVNETRFLVSDGGSNQEECHYMGKPVLLLREVTERKEGLGENAVLSKFKQELIDEFAGNYAQYERPPVEPLQRPSDIIIDTCRAYV